MKKDVNERVLALSWWNNLPESIANQDFANRYYPERHWKSLTGREIQIIWENLGKPSKIV